MKPEFNVEPKYRVTMLTREECTRGPRTPAVKRFVWFTDGDRDWSLWAVCKQKVQYLSR